MTDNIKVIDAANATQTLRAVDQGNGTLIMGSIPMLPNGTAMVGVQAIASSLAINPATNASFTTLISNAFVTAQLSAGAAIIGSVKITDGTATAKVATTAPSSSDAAMFVALSPNGLNANGGTSSANSAPVVIASDQTAIPTNMRVVGYTALPSSVANSTALQVVGDKTGRMQVVYSPRELKASQTGSTATAAETIIINALNATTYADLYGLVLANSGSTTTRVDLRYGVGSSIIATIEVPATDTRGFMLPAGDALVGSLSTANVSWTMQCAATTVMSWSAFYVKNI